MTKNTLHFSQAKTEEDMRVCEENIAYFTEIIEDIEINPCFLAR